MAGVPVLVSNTGANYEIVKDKVNAIMFNYNDINSLKEKIEYIINNYDNIIKLSKKAYEYASSNFSLESFNNSIRLLYEGKLKIDET